MYTIAFSYHQKTNELIAGNVDSLYSLVSILENGGIYFTVSNRTGKLEPKNFGWSDFEYWEKQLAAH